RTRRRRRRQDPRRAPCRRRARPGGRGPAPARSRERSPDTPSPAPPRSARAVRGSRRASRATRTRSRGRRRAPRPRGRAGARAARSRSRRAAAPSRASTSRGRRPRRRTRAGRRLRAPARGRTWSCRPRRSAHEDDPSHPCTVSRRRENRGNPWVATRWDPYHRAHVGAEATASTAWQGTTKRRAVVTGRTLPPGYRPDGHLHLDDSISPVLVTDVDVTKYAENARGRIAVADDVAIDGRTARDLAYLWRLETAALHDMRAMLISWTGSEPRVTAFLATWAYERYWLARALRDLLDAADRPLQPPGPRPLSARARDVYLDRLLPLASPLLGQLAGEALTAG